MVCESKQRQYLNDTPLKVHVAVDSGMGRIGVVNEEELTVEAVLKWPV